MRTAFKEWAVVVELLGRGRQIIILRKGGISEGRGGFQLEHPEFWLFPTRYHQQREGVIEEAQAVFDRIAPLQGNPDWVRLEYCARVVESRRLECLSDAEALRGLHCWRDEVIADRFSWGREANIFALALRVYRLPRVIELPVVAAYGGCKSWIELESEVSTVGAVPVLDDPAFDRELARVMGALNPGRR
jgi:hypothetical protein